MTGVDVEHTKAQWIGQRQMELLTSGGGFSSESAWRAAEKDWPSSLECVHLALIAAVERVQALATEWATQPTDYDEDTEQQIEDGKQILAILEALETP